MLVALFSDIHDHTTHLLLALQTAREQGCTHLCFMGDMAGFSTFSLLCEEWPFGMDIVFGNNEYEIAAFRRFADKQLGTTLHGVEADIVLDNRHVYFTHLPWHAKKTAEAGGHDAVFYGHTHEAGISQIGRTLLVNPGEIYGRQAAPSIGVYDTTDNSARIICI